LTSKWSKNRIRHHFIAGRYSLGKPNVIGTLIGVILLTVLMNWITLLGLRTFIVWLARGSLLLIGVMIVTLSSYQKKEYRIQIR
jgi:ribose/xylose/arabinose/galactoside ABC-type transport system permease subunit